MNDNELYNKSYANVVFTELKITKTLMSIKIDIYFIFKECLTLKD